MPGARKQRPMITALALLLMAAGQCGSSARAQLCFPTPHPLPDLPGAPDWSSGASHARSDADEPRWAAAPLTHFDSDMVGSQEGAYRVLYDASTHQLVVSLQALSDLGGRPSDRDSVYFGLSTSAAATSAQAVRIDLLAPNGTPDPKPSGLSFVRHTFTSEGGWFQPDGPTPTATAPAWLRNAAAWVEPSSAAAWVVSFRVSLTDVGLAPGSAFKVALGLHIHNELGASAVDLTTPDIGTGAIADLVQSPHTPSGWQTVAALDAGCAPGIALDSTHIGTRHAQPSQLDTTPGAVNRLFAAPSIPAGLSLAPGLFVADFRSARWGSVPDVLGAWRAMPGARSTSNGPPGASELQIAELSCAANTATETCGLPTPLDPHQLLRVELSQAPGSKLPVRFSRSSAIRNLRFEDLSALTDRAFISVKGLEAALGDQAARTLYLYADRANLPPHGDKPLWLPARAMFETRRIVESAPPAPPPRVTKGRAAPAAASSSSPAASLPQPKSARPDTWLAYSDQHILRLAWPTYAVHVYYALGTRTREDKREYVRLEPMLPFIYHFAHDGALYGFSHKLHGPSAQLHELQPSLYQVSVPNEGELELQVRVSAEEAPLHAQECTPIDNLKRHKSCACSAPGVRSGPGAAGGTLSFLLLLLCSSRLQRRRGLRRSSAAPAAPPR